MTILIDALCNAAALLTLILVPIIGLAIKEHHHANQK